MKLNNPTRFSMLLLSLFSFESLQLISQDTIALPTVLSIKYILPTNKIPYLLVNTKKKIGRKFEPVKGIPISVYFYDTSSNNLLGKTVTDNFGTGKVVFPINFKTSWDSLNTFKFLAISNAPAGKEELSSEVTIKKSILIIDTLSIDGVKTITAELKEKIGNNWVAIKDIEMKLCIKRMLGDLTVGDAETYTSDSTGIASAEFKRDSLAGDEKGNLLLMAKVEDNDSYGNLIIEKSVPWGKAVHPQNIFLKRALWSTGNRVPIWLLIIALSIIMGVWSTLFYLIKQIFIIKKLGKNFDLISSTSK